MDFKTGDIVFDDWRIVRKIGTGASGRVYQIEKTIGKVKMDAALKVIHFPQDSSLAESLSDDGMSEEKIHGYLKNMLDDLVDEIVVMVQMKGASNLVGCEDYAVIRRDADSWDVLIRMELLTSLQKYQKTHTMTEQEVYTLAVQMTKALSSLERQKIIHRDIKPENIFVTAFGEFKLGDFGIARNSDGTSSMSIKGTENYMAPEVFFASHYDQTVDIYSLGLVLYRLLNRNRFPFYPLGDSYTPLQSQQARMERLSGRREIPRPAEASDRFAEIILKMCAYEPKDRYQDADELMKALRSFEPKNIGAVENFENRADNAFYSQRENVVFHPQRAGNDEDDRTLPLYQKEAEPSREYKPNRSGSRIAGILIAAAFLVMLAAGVGYLRNVFSGRPTLMYVEPDTESEDSALSLAGTETKAEIEEIVFLDSLERAPRNAADVSKQRNKSVLCWTEDRTMYIAGKDGVRANGDSGFLFAYYTNLKSVDTANLDVSAMRAAYRMFFGCSSLQTLDVSRWDVSALTDMYAMFYGCGSLTDLDVSRWDVSSSINMGGMFYGCGSLTDLDVNSWNVSAVTNMNSMFYGCSELQTLDVSSWNVSNVLNMSQMFYECSSLRDLDVSSWNVSGAANTARMFDWCSVLPESSIPDWYTV